LRKLSKTLSAVAIAFLISSIFVGSAFAAPKTNNDRPGWGHGDKHHHHIGPPGHSNRPSDRFGDGDKEDNNQRESFNAFFANLISFFRHHGFPNA